MIRLLLAIHGGGVSVYGALPSGSTTTVVTVPMTRARYTQTHSPRVRLLLYSLYGGFAADMADF